MSPKPKLEGEKNGVNLWETSNYAEINVLDKGKERFKHIYLSNIIKDCLFL